LAFPALTRIAAPCSVPRPILDWQSRTEAERIVELVNTPDIVVSGDSFANIISLRSIYFIPVCPVANCTPFIIGSFGKESGASGDFFIILPAGLRLII
jgi:hypothetical protein